MAALMDEKPKLGSFKDDDDKHSATELCKLCLKDQTKYTCPRCNIGYCSVACYQSEKHAGCSEAFYKDWVMDSLKDSTVDSDDKKKVLEMLMKDLEHKADEESDDDEEDDLAERLEGLDLDKDIGTVWSRLTPKEKEQFARMLQEGHLARLIEIWTPWWKRKENMSLVTEKKKEGSLFESNAIPDIMSNVPDVNELLKNVRPSSNVRYDVLNILHAYAFVARLHNGSHIECPVDAAQDLLANCCVLQKGFQCGGVVEAVQTGQDSLMQNSKSSEKSSPKFYLTILQDVRELLKGPGKTDSLTFVRAALSDVVLLCQTALAVLKSELKSKVKAEEDVTELRALKSSIFKAEKKVLFLLSWSQRYGLALHQLLPLLQFEIENREDEVDQVEEIKTAVETHMDNLKPDPNTPEPNATPTKDKKTVQKKMIEELS